MLQSYKVSKLQKFSNVQVSETSKCQHRRTSDISISFFKKCGTHICNFPTFYRSQIPQNNMFDNGLKFSWIIWSVLVSPKLNNIGFEAQGHVPKSRNHKHEGFEGSHINKSKSYKVKLKQNDNTELLSIFSINSL